MYKQVQLHNKLKSVTLLFEIFSSQLHSACIFGATAPFKINFKKRWFWPLMKTLWLLTIAIFSKIFLAHCACSFRDLYRPLCRDRCARCKRTHFCVHSCGSPLASTYFLSSNQPKIWVELKLLWRFLPYWVLSVDKNSKNKVGAHNNIIVEIVIVIEVFE